MKTAITLVLITAFLVVVGGIILLGVVRDPIQTYQDVSNEPTENATTTAARKLCREETSETKLGYRSITYFDSTTGYCYYTKLEKFTSY